MVHAETLVDYRTARLHGESYRKAQRCGEVLDPTVRIIRGDVTDWRGIGVSVSELV